MVYIHWTSTLDTMRKEVMSAVMQQPVTTTTNKSFETMLQLYDLISTKFSSLRSLGAAQTWLKSYHYGCLHMYSLTEIASVCTAHETIIFVISIVI